MSGQDKGEQLDALNRQAIRDHARNIADRGVAGALDHEYRPGGGTLLEALRRNAEQVYGEAPRAPRARGV
jgi:hypothetical protein